MAWSNATHAKLISRVLIKPILTILNTLIILKITFKTGCAICNQNITEFTWKLTFLANTIY